MNLPLFIARRIQSDQGDERKVSRPAIRIATIGVAIGLAVMIVSVCVVLGFKHTIRDKVVGFGSHINVANFMCIQSTEELPVAINDSMMHVDFMIGTEDLNIDALTRDGKTVPIFRKGTWAF